MYNEWNNNNMIPYNEENEIFNSLQGARALSELFSEENECGIPGDSCANWQFASDIANGIPVRDALERQRNIDCLIGNRKSSSILADLLTDDLIARDVENGMDIGEAMLKEEGWGRFFDDLLEK